MRTLRFEVAIFSDKLFHVYAHQREEQVEQGYSASFLAENSVLGVELKAVNEGEGSAAPVTNGEKWLHQAIVAFIEYAYAETQRCCEFGAESGLRVSSRMLE
ncbi:MAG: hypothetical protein RMY28_036365 [Nostoc sp. ChiSLP01]|nr:hypothetical protein [Nostoc sp. CmiSLP01]MDZ8286355.1 hypothetical protein [Nostoc sp. ChiSLP01]